MIEQYPDTIIVTWSSLPVEVLNEGVPTGDYLPGAAQSFESECRIEANTQSRKTQGVDGALIDYAYDVFLPLADVIIPAFEAEFVATGTVGEIRGKVKRAKNGQLNSRIWL